MRIWEIKIQFVKCFRAMRGQLPSEWVQEGLKRHRSVWNKSQVRAGGWACVVLGDSIMLLGAPLGTGAAGDLCLWREGD